MSHAALLTDLLRRVLAGDPWHGSNIATLLDGLSAADASRHVATGGHSIWELVVHMTAWTREVHARLERAEAGEPAGGDWPEIGAATETAWADATRALFETHAALANALAETDDARLDVPVIDHRDRAAGTGLSTLVTLHGLVHHTVYHAGQIALLRRALRDE